MNKGILEEIENNARMRESTMRKMTAFLNDLNDKLFDQRIGRRVEIPIEITTNKRQFVGFGWGRIARIEKWTLYIRSKELEIPIMESSVRTRILLLDSIPHLLSEISDTLRSDTEKLETKINTLIELVEKL